MKKLLLAIISFLILSSVSAIELETYDATVTLSDKMAHEEITIFAKYSGEKFIKLNLPPNINNLDIEINGFQANCDQKTILGSTEVVCPINFESDYYIKAEFDTSYVLIDLDEKYLFKQELMTDYSIEKVSFRLKLPEGGLIPQPTDKYITPNPTSIYSDGRKIILLFEKQNIENNFEISVIYEYSPKSYTPMILTSIILISIVSVILFVGFSKRGKKDKKPKEDQSEAPKEEPKDEPYLLSDEKLVINILKESEENIRQKDIEKQVDFSKAKLSRILRNLEERGLIKRIPRGNTNIIELLKK